MTIAGPMYQIRVRERLGPRRECWFGHMTIEQEATGETLITGPIVDEAALHGTLTRIRDLGLTLLSICRIDHDNPGP
mgnify:CR=1 FL=1